MPRQPILSVLGHIDAGKCVSPETRIQLSDGGLVNAESLFQRIAENGEKLEEKDGEVYRIQEGPEVLGIDEEGKVRKCNVDAGWKLEKNEIFEFELSDGSEIEVTPEHPFLTVENGEMNFVEARNLDKGEMVALPSKLPVKEISLDELKIKLFEKLSAEKRFLAFVSEGFSEELAEAGKEIETELMTNHLDSCRRDQRFRLKDIHKISEDKNISLDRAYDQILELKQATTKFRAGKTSNRISLPENFSEFEDLAYAAGLMLGDGSRESTRLYNNSSEIRTEFETSIENSIGVQTVTKKFDDKVDEVYIKGGKTLAVFFEHLFEFPVERKSQSIKISNFALQMPKNILANLISGYLDADGYVSKKGAVEVTSASEEMIYSLKSALKQFGISSYLGEKDKYYTLRISGEKNLRNYTQIGFRHPDKKKRLSDKLNRAKKDPVTGSTPITGDYIRETRMELGASHTEIDIAYQKNVEEYSNISKMYLKRFCGACRDLEDSSSFLYNIREKKAILNDLKSENLSRKEIYGRNDIDHRRLLNHVLSLKSENLIEKENEKLRLTTEGEEKLNLWNEEEKPRVQKLERIAKSDLEFAEIKEIDQKEGGTVYDFTTELETFVAEDVIVHNTTLLDRIRSSRIVEGEAGGITQMIGATEVPIETVEENCGDLLQTLDTEITIPGLLFIDTPGHAAFSSLRKRGGNIADIAVVVVDVEDGVQPQTEEAIRTLKESGTPFVIALNKIDMINGWQNHGDSFMRSIQKQSDRVQKQVDDTIYELMAELDNFDMMVDRFDRVDDFRKKVAIVPVSAMTGEGLPELLMVLVGLAQRYLKDNLEVHEGIGRGTVLEVSQMEGMGTTIDVIQYDGIFRKTDKLVYGTRNGVKETDIRAMLKPKQLSEIRAEKEFQRIDESKPAAGVRLVGKDLEGVVSGAPVRVASEENLEEARKEVEEELESVGFETTEHGIVVKADSLGSLEALMNELEGLEVMVQKAEVGKVTKADVIDAQNEEEENRAIFAFSTGYTDQGKAAAIDKDVKVFEGDIIYQLLEGYDEWREELKRNKRERQLEELPRPAKIRILHEHVFRASNPAVVGVKIEDGVLNPGSTLMNDDGETVGRVKSVQEQNESVDKAEKGSEVAVSISNATVGRDFEEGETLYTKLTGDEYRKLKKLEDLTSQHEKNVTEKIVEIQDSVDPRWKIG